VFYIHPYPSDQFLVSIYYALAGTKKKKIKKVIQALQKMLNFPFFLFFSFSTPLGFIGIIKGLQLLYDDGTKDKGKGNNIKMILGVSWPCPAFVFGSSKNKKKQNKKRYVKDNVKDKGKGNNIMMNSGVYCLGACSWPCS
jgi:hypothetical protein